MAIRRLSPKKVRGDRAPVQVLACVAKDHCGPAIREQSFQTGHIQGLALLPVKWSGRKLELQECDKRDSNSQMTHEVLIASGYFCQCELGEMRI